MKQAKSIFLSGGLIDANNASHSDYYNKGTICPFCLEKVFWARPHEKLINGTLYPISATFKHHKGDPLDCEARAKSAEGKKLLESISGALSSESREQRKIIWKKYLWEIYRYGLLLKYPRSCLNGRINFNYLDTGLGLNAYNPNTNIYFLNTEDYTQVAIPVVKLMAHLVGFLMTIAHGVYDADENDASCPGLQMDWRHWITETKKQKVKKLLAEDNMGIKTPVSIHFSVTLEVMTELLQMENIPVLKKIALFLLDIMPSEMMSAMLEEMENYHEYKNDDFYSIKLQGYDHISFKLFEMFFAVTSSIDWLELSKKPWKNIVSKKRTASRKGKGFAVV